jgi:hypothetical protein
LPSGVTNAAETHVIKATSDITWKSADGESDDAKPLIVKVNKGDILEIKISGGPHGFITIDRKGTDKPKETRDPVLACGEPADGKGKYVLREIECDGDKSNFGKEFIETLKLEVTENFDKDQNFWCVRHREGMWGTIELKR